MVHLQQVLHRSASGDAPHQVRDDALCCLWLGVTVFFIAVAQQPYTHTRGCRVHHMIAEEGAEASCLSRK